MKRSRLNILIPIQAVGLGLATLLGTNVLADSKDVGTKGADVYCFMRSSGNSHKVSWDASYEIIKRQKSSLFKTSPKHAAVMIIETVVQNPEEYRECGNYLGDLFSPVDSVTTEPQEEIDSTEDESPKIKNKGDRYSY